jgi:hypothetical protein
VTVASKHETYSHFERICSRTKFHSVRCTCKEMHFWTFTPRGGALLSFLVMLETTTCDQRWLTQLNPIFDICLTVHHWYKKCRQPTRCNNNYILVIPISSPCFGRWFRPSSGALDCVYSLWYNAPTMLLAGSLEEESIRFNNSNQLVMFRAMISPIFRSTRLCLQLVV